jgi:predicted dehydrogenase
MISIAVIGCGAWGPNHIRVFGSIPDSQVTAAADTDPERLESMRTLFPDLRLEADPSNVLRDPTIDAVVVATPTSTHHRLICKALEQGKHVLSEKPLAQTCIESEELVELAAAQGVTLMVGHVFLFNAGILKLGEALQTGEVGEPLFLSAVRTNLGPIRSDVNAAYDLATHDISIFNWLLGTEAETVSATGASFLQPAVEDVVAISLKYPENIFATIQASWLNPKKVRQITVVGTHGMMVWDDLELSNPVALYDKRAVAAHEYSDYGEFLRISMSDGDVRLPKVQLAEPLRVQARYFLDRVAGFKQNGRADGSEAVKVIRTLEAITRSLEAQGAPITVAAKIDAC